MRVVVAFESDAGIRNSSWSGVQTCSFLFSSRRRHTRFKCDWSSDVCFSFPSRRRHTRFKCDWSSDVCSSDLRGRLAAVIDRLATFAARYRDLACLAYTHLQPAQPTTVGKRACLWAYDLVQDLREIEYRLNELRDRKSVV